MLSVHVTNDPAEDHVYRCGVQWRREKDQDCLYGIDRDTLFVRVGCYPCRITYYLDYQVPGSG